MKIHQYCKLPRVLVFFILFFNERIELSQGQCVGDVPLPAPAGINLSVPVGTLTDFSGEVMGTFNSVVTNPISILGIGDLLPPIGGFIPEADFVPPGQVIDFLRELSPLLESVSICDIELMRMTKPTVPDMEEYWSSPETVERRDHLQSKYDTNVADENFGLNATVQIPNKGGAPIPVVIANYVKTQVDAALAHVLPFQFLEPVGMVFVDAEIQCRPKVSLPVIGCIPLPFCIPAGASYNHVESVYNVHRPGHHALIPDVVVTPMMEDIKVLERATSNWLPFIVVAMNKMDVHGYWGSRNPENVNNLTAALFMAIQDPSTQKALEQNVIAQDMSGLLIPFAGDAFTVTGLPSVLSTGSIPGFGSLPFFSSRKMSAVISAFPLHPFVKTQYDEYKPGFIHSDDINPIKYFEMRSMVPALLNQDSGNYSEVIKNFYWLHGNMLNVAQSQEHDKDSIYRYSRLVRNTGGLLMQDETAPGKQKQQAWLNPLSGNNCVSFRGRAAFPEPTFANSTARTMCEVNQAIFAEQRECKAGVGRCPGPRDSYWPYKQSPTVWGCSSEYSDFPDPEESRAPHPPVVGNLFNFFGGGEPYCMYDRYQMHNTHAQGIYNGSVLPQDLYPPDEDDIKETESALVSHYHRQRDCMDEDVARLFFSAIGANIFFCGWERCDDIGQFEPAPNCVATNRYRPDIRVPVEGCS